MRMDLGVSTISVYEFEGTLWRATCRSTLSSGADTGLLHDVTGKPPVIEAQPCFQIMGDVNSAFEIDQHRA